jgi:hypothetical protein
MKFYDYRGRHNAVVIASNNFPRLPEFTVIPDGNHAVLANASLRPWVMGDPKHIALSNSQGNGPTTFFRYLFLQEKAKTLIWLDVEREIVGLAKAGNTINLLMRFRESAVKKRNEFALTFLGMKSLPITRQPAIHSLIS